MKYLCSIYKNRPGACVGYPWNFANQIFEDCQFLNENKDELLSMEELQKTKSEEDISEFCVTCGKCCFFGTTSCSKLLVIDDEKIEVDKKE